MHPLDWLDVRYGTLYHERKFEIICLDMSCKRIVLQGDIPTVTWCNEIPFKRLNDCKVEYIAYFDFEGNKKKQEIEHLQDRCKLLVFESKKIKDRQLVSVQTTDNVKVLGYIWLS